jgi:hypothetical protein
VGDAEPPRDAAETQAGVEQRGELVGWWQVAFALGHGILCCDESLLSQKHRPGV